MKLQPNDIELKLYRPLLDTYLYHELILIIPEDLYLCL